MINHRAAPLINVAASAAIYDLSGRLVRSSRQSLTAPADACTDAFSLDWPGNGAYLARLELRDKDGQLLSRNFYWHARDERQLQQLNAMPEVALEGKTRVRRTAKGIVVEAEVKNPSQTPALQIRLTLRDARTGLRILPVYYGENYFSLLAGESRTIRIESPVAAREVRVTTDGWNIKPTKLDNEAM
ncbi:MAG: hypothetical protein KGJ60_02135 [Verrucomicrobiota bacterium]|nr:hypothetical protein [Verrucomicrobiota bacterium]